MISKLVYLQFFFLERAGYRSSFLCFELKWFFLGVTGLIRKEKKNYEDWKTQSVNEKVVKLLNQTNSWLWKSYLMCTGSQDCTLHTDQNFSRYTCHYIEWTLVLYQIRNAYYSFSGLKCTHRIDTKPNLHPSNILYRLQGATL